MRRPNFTPSCDEEKMKEVTTMKVTMMNVKMMNVMMMRMKMKMIH